LGREVKSVLPILIVFTPCLSLAGALLWRNKRPRFARFVYVGSSVLTFILILLLYPRAMNGTVSTQTILEIAPRITLGFRIDTLGFYFGLLLSVLWVIASFYSLGYITSRETRYYSFLSLNLSFCLGVAFSANMFTLFIFYELMSLFTYPLIIHDETDIARRAGLKYLVYSITAGAVILAALIMQYFYSGTLAFTGRGTIGAAGVSAGVLKVIFSIYLLGFGVKACIMPLHGWVPDAHPAAPAPASALLSGVILKVGVFGIMRVVYDVFGVDLLKRLGVSLPMLYVASITIIVASIFAITQTDLKRRLAYSSVGQVSYIIFGLFLLSKSGAYGAMLHVAHHAFMKGTLFLCSGIIMHELGTKDVREMDGAGAKIPLTMIAFSIAALGMMGTPVTCGFISKWLLGVGSVEAHRVYFIAVLLISSLLNAVYFLPIVYSAFFKKVTVRELFSHEAPLSMLLPTLICAVLVLILGVFVTVPGLPYSLIKVVMKVIPL